MPRPRRGSALGNWMSVFIPGAGGNDSAAVFEGFKSFITASFTETGFDSFTCNATASFQDNVV